MEQKVCIKKANKSTEYEDLEKCSKEILIEKIKSLAAHNTQLKNIIAKSGTTKPKFTKLKNKEFDFFKCNYRHIALNFLYLGWNYKGYVVQEDTANTIEHHLFEALIKTRLIKDRASSNYHRCGRTDKGVSSFGQVVSIDVRSNLSKDKQKNIKEEINYCKILNKALPDNIQCIAWSPVTESFSARFDCTSRTYKYFFPKGNLDIQKMRVASNKLLGTHDFRNFCKMDVGNGVVEFVRNVLDINIQSISSPLIKDKSVKNDDEHSMYVISIKGKAFLWHQIRAIMGILFLIGENKEEPTLIDELLNINNCPRKPEYNMGSEIPLNLFFCDYDNMFWHYNKESLSQVLDKLNSFWTFATVKESMIKSMVNILTSKYKQLEDSTCEDNKCFSEFLLQGVKSKKYIPVLKRPTCDSLEEKIKHFSKRKRIQVSNVS